MAQFTRGRRLTQTCHVASFHHRFEHGRVVVVQPAQAVGRAVADARPFGIASALLGTVLLAIGLSAALQRSAAPAAALRRGME